MLDETLPLLAAQQKPKSRWSSVYWLCTVVFFLAASGSILNVPLTQLVENNICSRYYHESDLAERNCKAIEGSLSHWEPLSLVEAVVGLFVAFPFGALADRIGRKPILVLAVIGSSLAVVWELAIVAFPRLINVQTILAGPMLTVLGGGSTVMLANLYTIASDLVDQPDRASAFFLMALSRLVAASLGPAISSKLMQSYTPWIAALTSLFINLLSLVPLLFVPETLSTAKNTEPIDHDVMDSEQSEPGSFGYYISRSFKSLLASFSSLKSYSLVIVLSTFLPVAAEIMETSQFMAQYISKRFGWSLAKAGYLLTLRGVINLFVLLLLLPLLSKILLRYYNATTKDLILARGSFAFAGIGVFLMAAPQIGVLIGGLAVHSLGSGLAPLCRSLATSYVAQEDTSKLNTVIGIVEMAGSLFAGPVLAWSFDLGMRMGGLGLGLPYFGLAGSFALCLVGLCFVRTSPSDDFIE
ncbi:hypothetical protein N7493_007156 [Penicillium malachiteum]|uniref:Major facilitator superfamily (MFS) profile domain-containing protein n=1 Tax=Penicillium malachiteum TaxID=1324776 RepID=A0AAD6HJI4_9EURO|nr:hypothetical protein N7493_007156 [Penicillium malachiteum]